MGAFLEGASCMDALEKQKDAVQKVLEPAGAAAGAEAACSAVHVCISVRYGTDAGRLTLHTVPCCELGALSYLLYIFSHHDGLM